MTQQGIGASPGYDALDVRRAGSAGLQAGVIDSGSYAVTQRGAGANQSVDVSASTGAGAYVLGSSVSQQALYYVAPHSGVVNESVSAAHSTLPRIDSVVITVEDNVADASGQNRAQVRVLTGTATSGANLNNRTGAATLPASSLLLADILVPAASSSVINSTIRDRRKWARGAFYRTIITSGDYTKSSISMGEIDTTNLKPRIECSGVPVRARLEASVSNSSASHHVFFDFYEDGLQLGNYKPVWCASIASQTSPYLEWTFVPAAGSHLLAPGWAAESGTATLYANTTYALVFTIEEIVRQNTPNNSVTSG